MVKRVLAIFMMIVFVNIFTFRESGADNNTSGPNCKSGICLEDDSTALTDDDIKALKNIYKKDEQPNLEFTDIRLKAIIYGSVYLLSARKPDYYGIKVVLSKESKNWIVLKKVNFIE